MVDMNAVALGSKGGLATAKKMTEKERRKRAVHAVTVREFRRLSKSNDEYEKDFARRAKLGLLRGAQDEEGTKEYLQFLQNRLKLVQLGHALGVKDKSIGRKIRSSVNRVQQLKHYGLSEVHDTIKEYVRSRQDWKCSGCGLGAPLDVHHIGASTLHSPGNLVALCHQCHVSADNERRLKLGSRKKKLQTNI